MSDIFIFRGKAATGKTYITNFLSNKLNIAVIRKDDIYDKLSMYGLSHGEINSASYDILAKIIQTNIDTNCSLIIDIGLYHKSYIEQFLSKINFQNSQTYRFLCICSNNVEWSKRIEDRLENPLPNQLFKSSKEAEEHYKKYDIGLAQGEMLLDSMHDISTIVERICEVIESK